MARCRARGRVRIQAADRVSVLYPHEPAVGDGKVGIRIISEERRDTAHALGVDTDNTARLVFAARGAGAYGSKLSGAGGGDCVIALAPEDRRTAIEGALVSAGGMIVRSAPHAPGVRVEDESAAP